MFGIRKNIRIEFVPIKFVLSKGKSLDVNKKFKKDHCRISRASEHAPAPVT